MVPGVTGRGIDARKCNWDITSRGEWQRGAFETGNQQMEMNAESTDAAFSASGKGRSVFISYDREDALEHAKGLAHDLKKRGDHTVFLDLENIPKGGRWDAEIERCIRQSSVVLALLTRCAVHNDSISRDEVLWARKYGKCIVPLLFDPDPQLELPLLLARLNWIDFTGNYEAGLEALLRFLGGDPAAVRPPAMPIITGAPPLDFSVEIAKYTVGFTGRKWVSQEINRWLATDQRRVFVIIAEPGLGKSSIAAWLTQTRNDVVAAHFCTQQNSRSQNPHDYVASLVAQLHNRLPGFAERVESRNPEFRRERAMDAFRELIVEPTRNLPRPERPWIAVIDSLDEAIGRTGETILDVLASQAQDLPAWLRFLATTRPEKAVLERIRALNVFELVADRPENRADLREYIRARSATPGVIKRSGPDIAVVAAGLDALAEGNFLYARLALDAIEEGALQAEDLGRLSPGLAVFFREGFHRRFPDLETYRKVIAPMLCALVAARAPLSVEALSSVLLGRYSREPCLEWESPLRGLRPYLREIQGETGLGYVLFHKALADWLTDPARSGEYHANKADGHRRLAEYVWQDFTNAGEEVSEYTKQHFAVHLAESERWGDLVDALQRGGLFLLERWTERESDEGLKCLGGMVEYLRSSGKNLQAASYATQRARILSRLDRLEEAERLLRKALAWCPLFKGRRTRAVAWHELASLHLYRGKIRSSQQLYRRALRLCILWPPRFKDEAAANLVALSTINLIKYRDRQAVVQARRGLEMARAVGDVPHTAAANRLLAVMANNGLRHDEARDYLRAAVLLTNASDLPVEKAGVSLVGGWMDYHRAALEKTSPVSAIRMFRTALSEARRVRPLPYSIGARLGLIQCALLEWQSEADHDSLREVEEAMKLTHHHPDLRVSVALARATVDFMDGNGDETKKRFQESIEAAHCLQAHSLEAMAWTGLGAVHLHENSRPEAENCWRKAEAVAGRSTPLRLKLVLEGIRRNRSGIRCGPL